MSVLIVVAGALFGVRVNTTPSLPPGLYVASELGERPVARGDLVAACPDTAAVQRLGRYWTNGRCPGGAARPDGVRPLAKPVAGVPGDTVRVDRAGVWVGGRLLPASAPLFRDRAGRPVQPALGVHVLKSGEYWLHSGRVPTSIDSRYTGPVRSVLERLRPIWTEAR
ncbi:S26 family signal peptidase [Rubrivirga sp. S365]|uniref:S26 family signal peptidase n=1 Tax=Rubrivirga sp. S365 TaxID=3076080 RepID=UPI0028D66A11|nr:S26 family signal peptidase [Rubrivirga sp. S365]